MEESVKIAIDIMGGDKSPDKNLEGINRRITDKIKWKNNEKKIKKKKIEK